jgi:predicted signal transduction protein with EAL and GGDEF domain
MHAFVDEVREVFHRTGANPRRLKLELTESLLVEDIELTIEHMNALKTGASALHWTISALATRRRPTSSACRWIN